MSGSEKVNKSKCKIRPGAMDHVSQLPKLCQSVTFNYKDYSQLTVVESSQQLAGPEFKKDLNHKKNV